MIVRGLQVATPPIFCFNFSVRSQFLVNFPSLVSNLLSLLDIVQLCAHTTTVCKCWDLNGLRLRKSWAKLCTVHCLVHDSKSNAWTTVFFLKRRNVWIVWWIWEFWMVFLRCLHGFCWQNVAVHTPWTKAKPIVVVVVANNMAHSPLSNTILRPTKSVGRIH